MDFDEIIKQTGNEYARKVENGVIGGDVTKFIDTGSYSYNALVSGSIYGGIPQNKISGIAGAESSGKTFVAMSMVKTFLDDNPEGVVIYFDSEGAITKEMCTDRHIPVDRMYHLPVDTVENFRYQARTIIDEYLSEKKKNRKPMMVILDSLGMLSTKKEMEDTAAGKDTKDMTRTQLLKATFRTLTLKYAIAEVPMFVTNHTYETMELFSKPVMSGGSGLKYAASSITFLSKSKVKNSAKEQTGSGVLCTMNKSRITKEGKQIRFTIDYMQGLKRYSGLIDMGLEFGVLKSLSNKIEFPNGEKGMRTHIDKNPDKWFTPDVLDLIDEQCKQNFRYGKDTEPTDEVLEDSKE